MSTNIDTNIVQMKFDNEQFEKNCAQSMSTLDKLKAKIDNTGSGSSLNGLGQAANNIDLSNLERSVEAVNNKFSVLGVMGATVINEITKSIYNMAKNLVTAVPNIIKQKGWSRAMNIEQAKFQLEGLGVAWEKVADDIDYAVSGTAYGLDAAAKACSQLVASGVQAGDAMKKALRGISGVAAMTNAEYEEIAPIFTTVAGQGKLMTMQLRQLENRGLNAAAVLGEALGKTEEEIRGMVTKGKIDFETFSDAMDSAFGEHAKDANKTFEGVIKNIKAALARIGADFFSPVIEEEGPIVKALQALREKIVDIKTAIQPTVARWKSFVYEFGTGAEKLLRALNTNFMGNIVAGFANILTGVWQTLKSIGGALSDIFGRKTNRSLQDFARGWEKFTRALILHESEMADLREIFRGIFSVVDLFGSALKELLAAIVGVNPATVGFRQILLKVLAVVSQLVQELVKFIKNSGAIQTTIHVISIAIKALLVLVLKTAEGFTYLIDKAHAMKGLQVIFKGLGIAAQFLVGVLALLVDKLIKVGKAIGSGDYKSLGKLGTAIIFIKDGVSSLIGVISQLGIVQAIIGGIATAIGFVGNAIGKIFGANGANNVAKNVTQIDDSLVPLAGDVKTTTVVTKNMAEAVTQTGHVFENASKSTNKFNASVSVAKVVAIGFVGALAIVLLNLSKALSRAGNGINNIGSFLLFLKNRGLLGLIGGTGIYSRTPNHILDIAIAVAALAGSMYAMSKIPTNKLQESLLILGKMAAGFAALLATMTILEKILGFTGALDGIGVAMLEVAASIAVVGAAMKIVSTIDTTSLDKAVEAFVIMTVAITGMSVMITRYGGAIQKLGLSFVAMAASMYVLVQALKSLNDMALSSVSDMKALGAKLAGLGVIALEMTAIAIICDKLGGKSFMRLAVSALALVAAIKIVAQLSKVLKQADIDGLKQMAMKLWETIKKVVVIAGSIVSLVAVVAGTVLIVKTIKYGLDKLLFWLFGISDNLTKIRKYQDYHKKALNTLATAGLVVAVAGAVSALSLVLLILVKADLTKNSDAFTAGLSAMALMFAGMVATVKLINQEMKKCKGAAAAMLASVVAFAVIIVSTIGVATYLYSIIADTNRTWQSKVGEIALMLGSLVVVLGTIHIFAKSISKLAGMKFSKNTTAGLYALVAMVAVVAGSIGGLALLMTKSGWHAAAVVASMVVLGAAVTGLLYLAKQLSKIPRVTQGTIKAIQTLTIAIAAIATSIAVIAKFGGSAGRVILATAAIGLILFEISKIAKDMANVKYSTTLTRAINGMVAVLVSTALSLTVLAAFGGSADMILASVAAIGTTLYLAKTIVEALNNVKVDSKAILALCAVLLASAGSLVLLTRVGNFDHMLGAVGSMVTVSAMLVAISAVISKLQPNPTALAALLAVAGAVAVVAGTLAIISDYNLGMIAGSAGIIAGTIGMLVAIADFAAKAKDISAGIAALAALTIEFSLFALALTPLASQNWASILVAAGAIAGILALFGSVIAPALGAAIETIIPGAVALAAIGVALIPAAAAMWIGAKAMQAMSEGMINFAIAARLVMPAVLDLLNTLMKYEPMKVMQITMVMEMMGLAFLPLATGMLALAPASYAIGLATGSLKSFALVITMLSVAFEALNRSNVRLASRDLMTVATVAMTLTTLSPAILAAASSMNVFASAEAILAKATEALGSSLARTRIVIENTFSQLPPKMNEIGRWIPISLQNGMTEPGVVASLYSAAATLANGIENSIRNGLQIHSESPLFKMIGSWVPQSLFNGIKDKFNLLNIDQYLDSQLVDITNAAGSPTVQKSAYDAGYEFGLKMMSGAEDGIEDGGEAAINTAEQEIDVIKQSLEGPYQVGTTFDWTISYNVNGAPDPSMAASMAASVAKNAVGSTATIISDFYRGMRDANPELNSVASSIDNVGGSSKSASKDVKDLSDAFQVVAKSSKVYLRDMANNLKSNIKEHYEWVKDVKSLVGKGYDQAVIDWVKKNGEAGHETVKALKNATAEEVADLNDKLKTWLAMDKETEKILSDKYGESGEAIAQSYIDAMGATFDGQLAETIQSAVSPFDEFDKKVELTGQKLLENMRSQLTGIREWGGMMNTLIEKGVTQSIIDHFAELGPASYEELSAFVSLTDEQLTEASQIWTDLESIGYEVAGGINDKMITAGKNATQGLLDGLDPEAAKEAGLQLGLATVEGTELGLEEHSPSKATERAGLNAVLGLASEGIAKNSKMASEAAYKLGLVVIKSLEKNINRDIGRRIGNQLTEGLAIGIVQGQSNVINSIEAMAYTAIKRAREAFDMHSPSKIFQEIGDLGIDGGVAKGINDGTYRIKTSIDNMAGETISQMASVISQIAENVNGEMSDISPVIKPKLDLSEVQNGKSFISSMFNGGSIGLAESIMVNHESTTAGNVEATSDAKLAATGNQTIIFNQTNNSPKNIDPYESYRLGRLGAMQMKGARA